MIKKTSHKRHYIGNKLVAAYEIGRRKPKRPGPVRTTGFKRTFLGVTALIDAIGTYTFNSCEPIFDNQNPSSIFAKRHCAHQFPYSNSISSHRNSELFSPDVIARFEYPNREMKLYSFFRVGTNSWG